MKRAATATATGGFAVGPVFVIFWNKMHPEAPLSAEEGVIIGSFLSTVLSFIAGLLWRITEKETS